jgi:hypothetical protein
VVRRKQATARKRALMQFTSVAISERVYTVLCSLWEERGNEKKLLSKLVEDLRGEAS